MVQLFEKFWGFVAIKSNRMMEFVPVVNLTKDVSIEIDIQEVKFVNDHRYMFKHTGKKSIHLTTILTQIQVLKCSPTMAMRVIYLCLMRRALVKLSRRSSCAMLRKYWRFNSM